MIETIVIVVAIAVMAIIALNPKEGKRTGRGKGKRAGRGKGKRFERGRRRWHEPEYLGAEQAERDARTPGREFHVYMLETELGHYIGHTGRLEQRLEDHIYGYVRSTKGADPRPLWISRPMDSRNHAARFEAAMKSYRDSRAPRYLGKSRGMRPCRGSDAPDTPLACQTRFDPPALRYGQM